LPTKFQPATRLKLPDPEASVVLVVELTVVLVVPPPMVVLVVPVLLVVLLLVVVLLVLVVLLLPVLPLSALVVKLTLLDTGALLPPGSLELTCTSYAVPGCSLLSTTLCCLVNAISPALWLNTPLAGP
jgi:hypothetical protein